MVYDFDSSNKIDSEEKLKIFSDFAKTTIDRYPQIKMFEVLNEPNFLYLTTEDIENYSKVLKSVRDNCSNKNTNIIGGALASSMQTTDNFVVSTSEFFGKLNNFGGYKRSNGYSYHIFDSSVTGIQNATLNIHLKSNKELFNDFGGFLKNCVTEYGLSTINNISESMQAKKLVQQTVLMDYYNIDLSMIYNFWNVGTDVNDKEHNFGLVDNSYIPKLSYYAMKNFNENILGSEYIGSCNNIVDGLEFHVYDKDGIPRVIAWSNNSDKDITIPYENFIAKDIYGNSIQTDETANLTITTSPIYLDNIGREYFYKAISNTINEKWSEFEEKFGEQISQVSDLQQSITQMKQTATEIGTHSEQNEIAETTAIEIMNEHYALGNMLIEAYKGGRLTVEDVKLSSMLDMLDDIGDSYEDLVTITAQTRNSNFEETNKKIEEAENVINNGKDLNNIYPSKILDFAKEFNEKATYINSLEEENDIKTGLIVSKNLHANLLADWAKQFADVYIDKYLQENPVQEITYKIEDGQEYKLENLTNKNVIATLPTTEDMQITSEGGNTHTFDQNDSFTFTYTRRGRNFEVVANVENIDKDAPIIKGVKNNKLYISQVSVDVEDKNLEDVKVICNDIEIKYTLNTPLNEEGIYEITATDKAGNVTKIVFQLIENASEIYIIGDEHIGNIQGGTTAKELKENLLSSVGYDIRRGNEILGDNEIIRTGDTIETKDMHQLYTLVVAGDVNKDGEINIRDLVRLRKYLLGQIELDELEIMSSDTNVDNKKISIKDFIRMSILILSK